MTATTPAPKPTTPVAIGLSHPLSWLAKGGMDFLRNPWPGLLHGGALTLFGALLAWVARHQFWWLAGAFSGLLVVGPVLGHASWHAYRGSVEPPEAGDALPGAMPPGA